MTTRIRPPMIASGRLYRCLVWLLMTAGAALLAWYVFFITGGYLAQIRAGRTFEPSLPGPSSTGPLSTAIGERGSADERPGPPARGAMLARLSIPAVELSAVILHGSDETTLRRGLGHLENSALPGERGNVVVAGRRDTIFRPLRNVKVGDDIYTETASGRFHYRVAWARIATPQDVSVLDARNETVLTLVTCCPFFFLDSAPEGFIVRAVGVDEATDGRRPAQDRQRRPVER